VTLLALTALLVCTTPADAPLVGRLSSPAPLVLTLASSTPASLLEARKLGEALRYEEAVVEYQRYLAVPERPLKERAAALMELAFIHLVLGDQPNADARALEAFELDPKFAVGPAAPGKQVDFVERQRKVFLARARLELDPRESDPPFVVRVKVLDPDRKIARVLLRHALGASGPFYSTEMSCAGEGDSCSAAIPPPKGADRFTAWYFVEGLDAKQVSVARVAAPDSALQLTVVDQRAWYSSPVVWGVAGAALVGIATVIYFLAPQPPK
jgi:hypothetical protein